MVAGVDRADGMIQLLPLLFLLGNPAFVVVAAAANKCYADRGELLTAVDDYISQDCPNINNCTVGQTYGYPINSWCTGNVTDMSELFSCQDGVDV